VAIYRYSIDQRLTICIVAQRDISRYDLEICNQGKSPRCLYFYAPRKISGEHIVAALSVRPSVRTTHSCPTHNFKVGFWNYFTEMTTILRRRVAQHLGPYLEGQGHSPTLQQNRVRLITLLFEVRFQKYFTEMITILRQRVVRKIWVPTLKVKVTEQPCSKIMSGP